MKIVVNRKIGESSGRGDSACAYVTYSNPDHARTAILCTDGFNFRRRAIKSMFGTTKYCHQFLAGRACNNPDCMYLHGIADSENSFTKEQMQSGRTFQNIVQPGRGPANPANDSHTGPGFPPSSYAALAKRTVPGEGAGAPAGSGEGADARAPAPAAPNAWKTGGPGAQASEALSARAAKFRQQQAAARAGEEAGEAKAPADAGGQTAAAGGTAEGSRGGSGPTRPTTAISLLTCATGLFLPLPPVPAPEGSGGTSGFGFALHSVPADLAAAVKEDADLLLPRFRQLTGALAHMGAPAPAPAAGAGGKAHVPPASAAWLQVPGGRR